MGTASRHEAAALSHASGNAAIDAAYAILNTDKEAVRAAYWNRLDEKTRMMVCHMAGLPAKKGKGALRDLNALERGQVHRECQRLVKTLETLLRCCQGGAMPSTAPLFDNGGGIAAMGAVQ